MAIGLPHRTIDESVACLVLGVKIGPCLQDDSGIIVKGDGRWRILGVNILPVITQTDAYFTMNRSDFYRQYLINDILLAIGAYDTEDTIGIVQVNRWVVVQCTEV